MCLNDAGQAASTPPVDGPYGQITELNSDTITITEGSSGGDNVGKDNGWNYIMYCWKAIPGYSAFGSYTGNGVADGPFVYTGFKPAFLMFKQHTNSGNDWFMFDSARSPFNGVMPYNRTNTAGAEGTGDLMQFMSNGFKIKSADNTINASGAIYMYGAWAAHPQQTSEGIPGTGRCF